MFTCKFCNERSFTNRRSTSKHERYCKSNPDKKIHWSFGKHLSEEILSKIRGRKHTPEELEKMSIASKGRKHTKESKEKISIGRKKYLSENPDKHPWLSNNKFYSQPCEFLKNNFKSKNYQFIEEFSILNYSIDIVFPEKQIGIEVNGNQHYDRNGNLTDYYQQRHDKIESLGWKIIEIHYALCYSEENFQKICLELENSDTNFDFNYSEYFSRKNRKIEDEKKIQLEKNEFKQQEIERKKEKFIQVYEKLGHEVFTKYGWVQIVSKELKMSHTHVHRTMKKYVPEILEKCFNRKK